MAGKYFSYSPEGFGLQFHDTPEEAEKAARDEIGECLLDGFWAEDVDRICWGEVLGQSTKLSERPRTEDDATDADVIVDYGLQPSFNEVFASQEDIDAARALVEENDDVEVDPGARVSVAEDGSGRWVQGWLWLSSNEEETDEAGA